MWSLKKIIQKVRILNKPLITQQFYEDLLHKYRLLFGKR
jgi:hypothetical protein